MKYNINNTLPFSGKLLVTDMDGTLLNEQRMVSPENAKALRRFTEGGGLFTLATGRMNRTVKPYLSELPVNVPGIVFNGAVIYDFTGETILWSDSMAESMGAVALRILDRYPGIGFQIFHGNDVYIVSENIETEKHSRREGFEPIITTLDKVPKPWYKILLAWDPEKLADVEAWLNEIGGEFHAVYSEPQFLELLNPRASKGHALNRLISMLNIPGLQVIAMGDNMNDMEMLQEADVGVATENAHELAAAAADFRCGSNDNHAVAEVIGWIENGNI